MKNGTHAMFAEAFSPISKRWALAVIATLLEGPLRFSDLKDAIPGISANLLVQRLQDLEQLGALRRVKLPPPASVFVYELTAWGRQSKESIDAMRAWLHDRPNTFQPSMAEGGAARPAETAPSEPAATRAEASSSDR